MAIDTTARQLHQRVPRAVLESVMRIHSLILLIFSSILAPSFRYLNYTLCHLGAFY